MSNIERIDYGPSIRKTAINHPFGRAKYGFSPPMAVDSVCFICSPTSHEKGFCFPLALPEGYCYVALEFKSLSDDLNPERMISEGHACRFRCRFLVSGVHTEQEAELWKSKFECLSNLNFPKLTGKKKLGEGGGWDYIKTSGCQHS